jgi:DNA (cytosine-5)-methyltransferase 1
MGELRAAEFFAGIGLMRRGLATAGVATAWANDIEAVKREMYVANFGADEFVLGDVRDIRGDLLPDVGIATASFPCTDLSLAGNRRGLGSSRASRRPAAGESSMFWEFARVLAEMGSRRPGVLLIENVLGFASSHGGADLRSAVGKLNQLGYSCDIFAVDARHFVAQSRPRMFISGLADPSAAGGRDVLAARSTWAARIAATMPRARLHGYVLPPLPAGPESLDAVVDRLPPDAGEWWPRERVERFRSSLSPLQAERLAALQASPSTCWRTAYRRTRGGVAVWEIRRDGIAGCLRTARGGSSKQALVEAGNGEVRVRWLAPREYARLMGAGDYELAGTRNQALFGFGDAVCVPVIAWICEHYIVPVAATAGSAARSTVARTEARKPLAVAA